MRQQAIKWLNNELPQLVAQQVLTPEAAERLRAHYGLPAPARPARLGVVIFAILGTLLIGAGTILLLAHNWDAISRPMRTVLSFLPLITAQALAAWVILRRLQSLAWREGAGTLLFLMIGASIALIAQTYNISGDTPRFILTWSLLGLPVAYLLNALIPALLYLWGITAWAGCVHDTPSAVFGYCLLAALLIPLFAVWLRKDRYAARPTILLWTFCISATIACMAIMPYVLPEIWLSIIHTSLFALMFLAGEFWFNDVGGFWSRPLRHFGAAGILITSFLLTFNWLWSDIARWNQIQWERLQAASSHILSNAILLGLLLLATLCLLVTKPRRKTISGLLMGLAPLLAIGGYCLHVLSSACAWGVIIFNIYLLAIGFWLLVTGIMRNRQGRMNAGLVTVGALIVARFFDSDLSFLLRGLIFIGLGIALLAANLIILRRKGAPHA